MPEPVLLPADTPILWVPPWVDRTPSPPPGVEHICWYSNFGWDPDAMWRRIQRASGRPPADEVTIPT